MLDVLKDFFRRWYFSRRYRERADGLCYLQYSYDDCLKVESIARRLNLGPEWYRYIEEVIDEWCWKHGFWVSAKTEAESEAVGESLAQVDEPVLEGSSDGGIVIVGHEVVGTYGKGEFFPDSPCNPPGCCKDHGEQPCSMATAPVDGHSSEDAERSKEPRKISPTRVRNRRRRACRKADRG